MAYKTSSSLISQVSVLTILLAVAGQALAGRAIINEAKNGDMKQPEWLIHDHSVLIPGIGRVMVPPAFGLTPSTPDIGSSGGAGTGRSYPGGDDTFTPIPGVEGPSPGSHGPVPAHAQP